jgi:hypothetical protein
MTDNHLSSAQVLSAVCDNTTLTDSEIEHVAECRRCHDWLECLLAVAYKGNMKTTLQLPPLKRTASDRHAAT